MGQYINPHCLLIDQVLQLTSLTDKVYRCMCCVMCHRWLYEMWAISEKMTNFSFLTIKMTKNTVLGHSRPSGLIG